MTRFSIIIPVYNVAPFLRECLDSVLEAERRLGEKIEIICIDDGSTDGSGKILDEEYANRVSIVHQDNAGVGAARNVGLDRATGEWIWCIDSDDIIHPESLSYISKELLKRNECPTAIFIGLAHGVHEILPLSGRCMKNFELSPNTQDCVWRTPAYTLFRRDLIGGIRFTRYTIAEDIIFSLTYFSQNPVGWVQSDEKFYYYRLREGSASTFKPSAKFLDEYFYSVKEIIRLIKEVLVPNKCIISWFWDEVYRTKKWSLFLVPPNAAVKYLPMYFDNFWAYNRIQRFSFDRRLSIFLFQLIPLPFFGKILIYYRELSYKAVVEFLKNLGGRL